MKKLSHYFIFQKWKAFVQGHKIASILIACLIIIAGYFLFKGKATAETHYVTANASKGTVVVSVTGSGQVAASNEIDLKAEASGKITYVGVKAGDSVRAGKTLFSLDARDAQKAVRDAETELETAQLDLDKFTATPDNLDVQVIQADIDAANKAKTDADKKIADAYENLLNSSVTPSATGNDAHTPPSVTGTYTKGIEGTITIQMHGTANDPYFTLSSTPAEIVGTNTIGTVSSITPQPLGDTGLFIKFDSNISTSSLWTITLPNKFAASYNSNLKAYQDAQDAKVTTVKNADLQIAQDNKKIDDLYHPDELELRSKQLTLEQRKDALEDAKQALSDYYISAPFDGTIASVTGKLGDTASGTLATIITKENVATISLNEVDVSKIKVGDKATLTFDAVDGLSIAGAVASIDSVGTVSQGVVNYSVKITFSTTDTRIKPGMTVSAAIVSAIAQDVLTVPASAVKTRNGQSYVLVFDPALPDSTSTTGQTSTIAPIEKDVTVGLSDDSLTEITSGLSEGDQIVSRTIATTTAKTATTPSTSSILGGTRTTGFGGGNATFRAGR